MRRDEMRWDESRVLCNVVVRDSVVLCGVVWIDRCTWVSPLSMYAFILESSAGSLFLQMMSPVFIME